MGNNNSKSRKSGDSLQSYPSFSRSDTQTSTKSARSIRSRLSVASDHGSFKSAMETMSSTPAADIPPAGSGGTPGEAPGDTRAYSVSPSLSRSQGAGGSLGPPTGDGYPFPVTLPRSMQQLEPKEPILMRRDRDGNFTNDLSTSVPVTPLVDTSGDARAATAQPDEPTSNSPLSTSAVPTTPGEPNGNGGPGSAAGSVVGSLGGSLGGSLAGSAAGTPLAVPLQSPAIAMVPSPSGPINIEEMIQRLLDAGYSGKTTRNVCLKNSEISVICRMAREVFLSQPMLLELSTPVKIVGDVHGQYGDLIRMFDMCGFPPAANYLFLGDYVDRGKQSLETILLLLCYKIKYPENFFLLRGNHECANVTRVYGFFDECKRRCNTKTWKIFIDTFNSLPIAAVVAQKIFCVHGGLSPSLNNLNEIRNIERPTDVPDYGLLNDLLWSDPADTVNEWEDNERGVSYCFNKVAINKFLAKFSFDLVCRAHMVVEDGYEFFNDRSLVTVFSAPNYCGEFDNWGAVMSVSEGLLCSFELLKPLDSVALKQEMKKGKHERRNGLITSPSPSGWPQSY